MDLATKYILGHGYRRFNIEALVDLNMSREDPAEAVQPLLQVYTEIELE